MREIKFRAWYKEVDKIVSWNDIKNYYNLLSMLDPVARDFEGFKVMQYTGLKDMNGVEMYEKDIVLNKANGKIGYITFLPQEMGYVIVYKNYDERLGHRNTGSSYDQDHRLKVIGNICENPELIA